LRRNDSDAPLPEYRNLLEAIDELKQVYNDLFEWVENPFPDADE
jgi:hypothetical protein